jgi:hypothetical protein
MRALVVVIFVALFWVQAATAFSSSDNSASCKCKFGALIELEKLNANFDRIRVENPNGIVKYPGNFQTYNSYVDCYSVAVYEDRTVNQLANSTDRTRDTELLRSTKKCRKCFSTGWTSIKTCESLRCDLDSLSGDFTLQPVNFHRILNDQNLFTPMQAIAVYKSAGSQSLCKICQLDGEWSAEPDPNLCIMPKKLADCSFSTLKQFEYQQFDYIRIRVESANGLVKINDREMLSDKLASGTVVLYQKYLSSLNISVRRRIGKLSVNYFNPFTKKFCRYCNDGHWSEIESCVSLNCDKALLTGSPELIFSNVNEVNRLKPVSRYLSEQRQQQSLFKPNSVVAIYTYGKSCFFFNRLNFFSQLSMSDFCNLKSIYLGD